MFFENIFQETSFLELSRTKKNIGWSQFWYNWYLFSRPPMPNMLCSAMALTCLIILTERKKLLLAQRQKAECPAHFASRKHPLYLLPGDVKFQCVWSLPEVIMSILQLSYRLYCLFYILVLNIFGLFRAPKNVGSKIRWLNLNTTRYFTYQICEHNQAS